MSDVHWQRRHYSPDRSVFWQLHHWMYGLNSTHTFFPSCCSKLLLSVIVLSITVCSGCLCLSQGLSLCQYYSILLCALAFKRLTSNKDRKLATATRHYTGCIVIYVYLYVSMSAYTVSVKYLKEQTNMVCVSHEHIGQSVEVVSTSFNIFCYIIHHITLNI